MTGALNRPDGAGRVRALALAILLAAGSALSALAAAPAHAEQAPATADDGAADPMAPLTVPPGAPPDEPEPDRGLPPPGTMLETTRRALRFGTEWLARGIDSWFGDRPYEDVQRVSRGRLGVFGLWRETEGLDPNLRFDARLRLPNAERIGYAFIGRDDDRELTADTPDELSRRERLLEQTRADQSFFAGIALRLTELFEFRVGLRARERLFAQVRYRHEWLLGDASRLEFRETLFWTLRERFGSTTSLVFEHALAEDLAARWASSATISQESRRYAWVSTPGVYKAFGGGRILSLTAPVSGQAGDGVPVNEYGAQVKWEQPIHSDWTIGEIDAGHYWPRADPLTPRATRWAVGIGLRVLF